MTDWLNKFLDGGQFQKMAKQLVSLIGKAYKEIQKGQPGQATQALVQVMKDPKGSQMLSDLAQQMPLIGEALTVIKEALQSMNEATQGLEQGGEIQAETLKAGGCPCRKKLMRIGGKICQITVDCNDNIVSE